MEGGANMAAYAAVVSLMHLMEQIQQYHAHRHIITDEQQSQLASLQTKVSFLQNLLEGNQREGSKEKDGLDSRIADAVYAAEDIIESYMVDEVHARSVSPGKRDFNDQFSLGIEKVIEDIDSLQDDVLTHKNQKNVMKTKNQKPMDLMSLGPNRTRPTGKDTVVVSDDILNPIMEKLTGHESKLHVVTITGMGGIGKTTLAKSVYYNSFIVDHFHIRGWVTVSQEYNVRAMLLSLVHAIGVTIDISEIENLQNHQLGEKIYKYLFGYRYLIIMDDVWSVEAWDEIKLFLPDNKTSSRILVTTRISNVAKNFRSSDVYKMNLLDMNESWSLFCQTVFVQERCPSELEEIGKQIAKKCNGLPLSIVVVGGLLAKSVNREYWEYIAKDIGTIVNSEDSEYCLKILYVSYRHLPIHLKPCFLYFAVFHEDQTIRVSQLIKLWVVEGFLKPNKAKSLEEVARDYLKDLFDKNLVFVEFGCTGSMKFCKIHDLLRDLCLREAHKEKFLYVARAPNLNISECFDTHRRLAIHSSMASDKYPSQSLPSSSFLRSFICNFGFDSPPSLDLKLLRVWIAGNSYSPKVISRLVNSRYLDFGYNVRISAAPSLLNLYWNLQVVTFRYGTFLGPSEIWEMPHLRHLMIKSLYLPDPHGGQMTGEGDVVLKNLHTLSDIYDLRCTEEVLRKIPNVKKLVVHYCNVVLLSSYHLNNLCHLHKLESLCCFFSQNETTGLSFFQNLELPLSLNKLTLGYCTFNWEDMGEKIGSLPHLKKLKFIRCDGGEEWNSVEGQFLVLKFLKLEGTDLIRWIADSTHFPLLEHLVLSDMKSLEEIPCEIGDIQTLQSIEVTRSSDSVIDSAKMILEEQRNLGNKDLRLTIK